MTEKKRPLAAVRGKPGVQVRTMGFCRNPTSDPLTQLRTHESLAQAVCAKIFLVEVHRHG